MSKRDLALIYIRRSRIKIGETTVSPERQLANCKRICEERQWRSEIFQDAEEGKHFSGRSEEGRPAWAALKARLADDDVVAVVVNSLDRATRSLKDFVNFQADLQESDVAFVSAKENFDTSSPMGRALLAMLLIFYQLESDMASERVTDTIAYKQSQGHHWGNAPYGYAKAGGEGGRLVPSDNGIQNGDGHLLDREAVALAYELYATGDWSYTRLAQHLTAQGYRMTNRYGQRRPFSHKNIRIILNNHWLYRGFVLPGGWHGDQNGHDEDDPPDDAAPGHEPLISRQAAEGVAHALKHRRWAPGIRSPDRIYLLTPILFCANCGARMRAAGKSHGVYRYAHWKAPSCRRGHGQAPAEELERQVLALLGNLHLPDDLVEEMKDRARQRAAAQVHADDALVTLARIEAAKGRLRELFLWGDIDQTEYQSEKSLLDDQARAQQVRLGSPDQDLSAILERFHDLTALLSSANPPQQKKAIGLIFERLECARKEKGWRITKAIPRPFFADFF